MGLLSFICWLLTAPRPGRRQSTDNAVRELTHNKFGDEFFDAASLHGKLRPVRSKIIKDRRR